MDAVEFLRYFRRMCWTYEEPCCENCKLEGGGCDFTNLDCDHEKAVRIVEKWAKEHPVKTRLSELKKLFPSASAQEEGYIDLCIKFFDSTVSCKDSKGCHECKKKFWFTPIEEEEK